MNILKKILERFFDDPGFFVFSLKKILIILVRINFLKFKLSTLVKYNLSEKPPYLYCMYNSAFLAKKLGHKKISVIEFGVAGGNSIMFIEKYSERIFKELGVEIEIYGFDLGEGMTEPEDYRDLPYWFKKSLYKMDVEKLNSKIKKTKLILGDVKDTLKDFFKKYNPAPISAIFNDLDYYSSTKNSFEIFNIDDNQYSLPRVFCYFDDIIGSENEMYGVNNGQLLAIEEFNKQNNKKKIDLNQNLLIKNCSYKFQIYYYHDFNHQDYNKFIFEDEQSEINTFLKTK
mgnify:FL=1